MVTSFPSSLLRPLRVGSRRPLARLLSIVGVLATLALVAFHAVLLWRRLEDLTILDPVIGAKWFAAVFLALVMFRFRKAGQSLVRGRRAAILWTLVLFLHAVVPVAAAQHAPALAEAPQERTLIVPLAIALALVVWLLQGLILGHDVNRPRVSWRGAVWPSHSGLLGAAIVPQLASRPPPALSA